MWHQGPSAKFALLGSTASGHFEPANMEVTTTSGGTSCPHEQKFWLSAVALNIWPMYCALDTSQSDKFWLKDGMRENMESKSTHLLTSQAVMSAEKAKARSNCKHRETDE